MGRTTTVVALAFGVGLGFVADSVLAQNSTVAPSSGPTKAPNTTTPTTAPAAATAKFPFDAGQMLLTWVLGLMFIFAMIRQIRLFVKFLVGKYRSTLPMPKPSPSMTFMITSSNSGTLVSSDDDSSNNSRRNANGSGSSSSSSDNSPVASTVLPSSAAVVPPPKPSKSSKSATTSAITPMPANHNPMLSSNTVSKVASSATTSKFLTPLQMENGRSSRPSLNPAKNPRVSRMHDANDAAQYAAFNNNNRPISSIFGPGAEPWSAVERNRAAQRQSLAASNVNAAGEAVLVVDDPSPYAKSTDGFVSLVYGILSVRLPYTQITLESFFIAAIYIGMNVGAYFAVSPKNYADTIGYLLAANSFLVAVPATRNSVLVWFLGIPFDKAIMYHRWLGYWVVGGASAHTIAEMVRYYQKNQDVVLKTFYDIDNVFGVVALLLTFVLLFTSLPIIRRRFFNFFFNIHFLFIAYYIFGSLHVKPFQPYAIATAAVYAFDRIIRLIWGFIWFNTTLLRIKGDPENDPDGSIIQMRFPKHPLARLFRTYKIGQYVFVNFPGISVLEWHPFSISSGPDERQAEIHIRGLGDHTKKLLEHVRKTDGEEQLIIRVDGPYGNHNVNYRRFPNIMLVAGGIGITPVMGIVKDLFRMGKLEERSKTPLPHVIENIYVVWVMKSFSQFNWFREELIEALRIAADEKMMNSTVPCPRLHVMVYSSRELENPFENDAISTKRTTLTFGHGHPPLEDIFNNMCVNMGFNHAGLVFACGPESMVNDCWDNAMVSSRNGYTLHFLHETFNF